LSPGIKNQQNSALFALLSLMMPASPSIKARLQARQCAANSILDWHLALGGRPRLHLTGNLTGFLRIRVNALKIQ